MVRKSMEAFAAVVAISSVLTICSAIDTITATQFIKDGDRIVSSGGSFELGFFSPGNSKYRYVGIWYKKISVPTVVWVANRKIPLNDTSGILKVNNSGFLNVVTSTNDIIWASSNTSPPVQNPVAQMLESGNLVIRELNDENPENFLWQSFDYPTDTQLPGMKLGINLVTGLQRYLSSWKSSDDPAPGEFTYHLDLTGYPQIILKKGSVEMYRTGPWNGLGFSGRPKFRNNTIYTHKLVLNKEEVYYMFEQISTSVLTRFVLKQSGTAERLIWVEGRQNWEPYLIAPTDHCDTYKLCGAYGSCNINNGPVCSCLDRFEPEYEDNWAKADWSNGCARTKPLDCHKGDGFRKYSHVKLPDTRSSRFNESMTLEECESNCLKNCSCMAYASLNINGSESGCLQWIGDLIDIRELPEGGQDFYVRVAFSESGT